MDIITRINELLQSTGLTGAAFAKKCGINQVTLNYQLLGKRKVSVATLVAIVENFDVNANWLLTGNGSMKNDDLAKAQQTQALLQVMATLQTSIEEQTSQIALLRAENERLKNKIK